MKTRQRIICSLILVVLAALSALPVLAQNDYIMVSRVRLAYTGRSSTGTDTVVGLVRIRDARRHGVSGALVTVSWSCPDGTHTISAETDAKGMAKFSIWAGAGTYTLTVTNVSKYGWDYRPEENRASSDTITVDSPPIAAPNPRQMQSGGGYGPSTTPGDEPLQAQPKERVRVVNSPTAKDPDR